MYTYLLVLIISTGNGDIVKYTPFHQFSSAEQCAASIRPATSQAYLSLDADLKSKVANGALDIQIDCIQGFGL
jgi:hypothetical protein